ncbi:hypothetical protein GGP94_003175 [Salinibacter ruber]|uniref:hypothetical protein n=1 Tax=Salinibacter ruber TaxID=146919 RepID=UPI00216967F1|nr:hypothetical protein [Salinibacter ruber]MCS4162727.1 hypothetical protein [Salinibacter ruber]
MAGISFDFETGQIDKGDTKTLRVSATDDRGERLKLDAITLEIDVNGAVTTLTKSDFSVSDRVYTTKHTFENAGTLQLTTDSDSWLHSLWHVLGAAAAGTALYLV